MNREIKFRGKRVDNGEWVYGSLFYFKATVGNTEAYFIIAGGEFNKETKYLNMCNVHEAIPETVGQYIGKLDKNKKEIYTDDVMIRKDEMFGDKLYKVTLTEFSIELRQIGKKGQRRRISTQFIKDMEIIGNIHDNSELLEA